MEKITSQFSPVNTDDAIKWLLSVYNFEFYPTQWCQKYIILQIGNTESPLRSHLWGSLAQRYGKITEGWRTALVCWHRWCRRSYLHVSRRKIPLNVLAIIACNFCAKIRENSRRVKLLWQSVPRGESALYMMHWTF